MKKTKRILALSVASALAIGTGATAFAAIPVGTVVIGSKAFDITYANTHSSDIQQAIINGAGKIFIKGFSGSWVNNANQAVNSDVIPAVTYTDRSGTALNYLANDGVAVGTPVTGDLKVESVSAINAKEIKLKFNKDVDNASAITSANYILTVGDTEYTGATLWNTANAQTLEAATISEAKGEVTFLLTTPLKNGQKYSVSVKDDVLSTDKSEKVSKYADPLKVFNDTTAPVAKEAEMDVVNGVLELTFNEHVSGANLDSDINGLVVKVDGQKIGLAAPSDLKGDYTVASASGITTAMKAVGNHTVTIYRATDLVAENPNSSLIQTINYTVNADSEAPVVKGIEAVKGSDHDFLIMFDKPVTASKLTVKKGNTDFTSTAKANAGAAGTSMAAASSSSITNNADDDVEGIVVTVDKLVDGLNKVYQGTETTATFTVDIEGYKAINNKVGVKSTQTVTITKDTTGPKVESVYENTISTTNLVVKFDKHIQFYNTAAQAGGVAGATVLTTADVAPKIVVRDKDGIKRVVKTVTITNNNEMTLIFGTAAADAFGANPISKTIEDAAAYTVEIPANMIEDFAGYNTANTALTTKVNPTNSAAMPVVAFGPAGNITNTGINNNVITVDYGVDMDASAKVLSNYTLDGQSITGDIDFVNGTKQVKITLPTPYSTINTNKTLVISKNVKTKGGSVIVKDTIAKEAYNQVLAFKDDTKPVLQKAAYLKATESATKSNKIKLTFSEEINSTDANDFKLVIGSQTVALSSPQIDSNDKKVMTVTLGADYNFNQAATVTVVPTTSVDPINAVMDTVDLNGNKLTEGTTVTASTVELDVLGLQQEAAKKAVALSAINAGSAILANYTDAGVTGVAAGNISDVNTAVAASKSAKGSALILSEVNDTVNDTVAVLAEVDKYDNTVSIANTVAHSPATDVTNTVVALNSGETANATVTKTVTAVSASPAGPATYLALASGVVTLKADNATGGNVNELAAIAFTKGHSTKTAVVTVTVNKN